MRDRILPAARRHACHLARTGVLLAVLAGCGRLPLAPVQPGPRPPAPTSVTSGTTTDRPGSAIARLVKSASPDSLARSLGSEVLGTIPDLDIVLLRTPTGSRTDDFVAGLQTDPRVVFAEPNERVQTAEGSQSTAAFSEGNRTWTDVVDQSALVRIEAAQAQLVVQGAGVRVAILDTGIDLDHPALEASIEAPGIEPGVSVDPGDDRPEGVDTNGDGIVDGSLGHGTHVAGIVHAVAPAAKLLAVRVLDSDGVGDIFRVTRGLVLAVGRNANVANLSLGLPTTSRAIQAAVDFARSAGVVVVAAAGNESSTTLDFPAAYPPVVAVAGTDPNDQRAPFSDYGPTVDVAAPAVGILSTYWDGTYAVWSGTSMAAPFVSGTAALVYGGLGQASEESAIAVEALVRAGASPLAAVDPTYGTLLGAGRVSALGSVRGLPPQANAGEIIVGRRGGH